MNARRVGDTARCPPPHTSASPLARFGQHDGPAVRRGLRSSHLLLSGRRRSRASKSSAQPCWPRWSQSTGVLCYGRLCHLPTADVMIDITQVVLLSVRQELRS